MDNVRNQKPCEMDVKEISCVEIVHKECPHKTQTWNCKKGKWIKGGMASSMNEGKSKENNKRFKL